MRGRRPPQNALIASITHDLTTGMTRKTALEAALRAIRTRMRKNLPPGSPVVERYGSDPYQDIPLFTERSGNG